MEERLMAVLDDLRRRVAALERKEIPNASSPGVAHAILSATHSDSTAAAVVRGDVLTGQGLATTWRRLALGTAGQVLTTDATDALWSVYALTGTAGRTYTFPVTDATLDDAGDPRDPNAHAGTHQHGGADEVATATPAANAIPKADAGGTLDAWITRTLTTTRLTVAASPYTVLATDAVIFADTDGGAIVVNLPAGIDGTYYKIVNCGTSSHDVTLNANGAETIAGDAAQTLYDGEVLDLHFEPTEGWY